MLALRTLSGAFDRGLLCAVSFPWLCPALRPLLSTPVCGLLFAPVSFIYFPCFCFCPPFRLCSASCYSLSRLICPPVIVPAICVLMLGFVRVSPGFLLTLFFFTLASPRPLVYFTRPSSLLLVEWLGFALLCHSSCSSFGVPASSGSISCLFLLRL